MGLDVPQPDGQQQQQQSGAAAAGKKRQRQDGADAEDAAGTDPAAAAEDDGEGPEEAAERAAAAAEAADNLLLAQPGSSQPDAAPQDLSQDPQAAVRAVLTGAVAKLVFQNALKAAASSKGGSSNYLKPSAAAAAAAAGSGKGLGFRAGFLEVLGRYKSPGVAGLRQEVLDSIRQDFPEVRGRVSPAGSRVIAPCAAEVICGFNCSIRSSYVSPFVFAAIRAPAACNC